MITNTNTFAYTSKDRFLIHNYLHYLGIREPTCYTQYRGMNTEHRGMNTTYVVFEKGPAFRKTYTNPENLNLNRVM